MYLIRYEPPFSDVKILVGFGYYESIEMWFKELFMIFPDFVAYGEACLEKKWATIYVFD